MTVLTPGRNIVLIGLMGAGKSTVGRLLAEQLGRPFVDTDEVVVTESGRTIPEIFAAEGERGFRREESAAVRHVAALRGQVIAVGGGAVLDPANVTQLRAAGDLVLLDAEPDALAARVGDGGDRPLLAGDDAEARLRALREARAGAYADAAGFAIDTTGRSPQDIAAAVLAWARRQPGLLARDELQP